MREGERVRVLRLASTSASSGRAWLWLRPAWCSSCSAADSARTLGTPSTPDALDAGVHLRLGQDTALCDASLFCALPLVAKNSSEYPSGSTTTSS